MMDLDVLQKIYEARFKKKHKRCSNPVIGITPSKKADRMNFGPYVTGMHTKRPKIGKMKGSV